MSKLLEKLIAHPESRYSSRVQAKRFWIHVPMGLIIASIALLSGALALCLAFLFGLYEINEDRHLNDSAWIDTKGVLAGIIIGGILWALSSLF